MKRIIKINKSEVMKLAWDNYKAFVKRFGNARFGMFLKQAWKKIRERVNFDNGIFWSGIKVERYIPSAITQEGYSNFYTNTKHFGD